MRALTPAELARLPVLYRAALSSLSVARAISLDRNVLDYLESLCGRAYLAVYGTRRHLREALGDFFARRFPRAVRAHAPHVALAAALLLLGAVTGFALTARDPERFYAFVDPAYAQGRGPTSSTESLREVLYAEPRRGDAPPDVRDVPLPAQRADRPARLRGRLRRRRAVRAARLLERPRARGLRRRSTAARGLSARALGVAPAARGDRAHGGGALRRGRPRARAGGSSSRGARSASPGSPAAAARRGWWCSGRSRSSSPRRSSRASSASSSTPSPSG